MFSILRKRATKMLCDCWYKIKTIYNTYVSFHFSVTESDFPLTQDTAVLIHVGLISLFSDAEQLNQFLILTHMSHIESRHLVQTVDWLPPLMSMLH